MEHRVGVDRACLPGCAHAVAAQEHQLILVHHRDRHARHTGAALHGGGQAIKALQGNGKGLRGDPLRRCLRLGGGSPGKAPDDEVAGEAAGQQGGPQQQAGKTRRHRHQGTGSTAGS